MRFLLDSSVITPLMLDLGERLLDLSAGKELYLIDLTFYEVGNSLWKLTLLLRSINLKDAMEILDVLKSLILRKAITLIRFDDLDAPRIIKLTVDEELTFYDASYIVAGEKLNATLATEDEELRRKAEKYINVITYKNLKQQILK